MLRSLRRHPELKLFAGAYLLYNAGRWLTAGDMAPATGNARWIVRTEETLGVAIEKSVQDGLHGGPSMWVLSHLYLAAQFVVLPGVLVHLYKRAPEGLPAAARHRAVHLADLDPRLRGFPRRAAAVGRHGLRRFGERARPVSLTGRSSIFYNELAAVPSLHCGFAVAVGIALAAAGQGPGHEGARAAVGPTRLPHRGRHGQPLRLRHRSRPGRRAGGLRRRRAHAATAPGAGARPACRPPGGCVMVHVAIVDRRPAVRHGYEAILRARHDLAPAGSASGRLDLLAARLSHRSRADPRRRSRGRGPARALPAHRGRAAAGAARGRRRAPRARARGGLRAGPRCGRRDRGRPLPARLPARGRARGVAAA